MLKCVNPTVHAATVWTIGWNMTSFQTQLQGFTNFQFTLHTMSHNVYNPHNIYFYPHIHYASRQPFLIATRPSCLKNQHRLPQRATIQWILGLVHMACIWGQVHRWVLGSFLCEAVVTLILCPLDSDLEEWVIASHGMYKSHQSFSAAKSGRYKVILAVHSYNPRVCSLKSIQWLLRYEGFGLMAKTMYARGIFLLIWIFW